MKTLSRDQLERRKGKAVRFLEDVLGDPDRADEIAEESLEDYAERRGIRIENSSGGNMVERMKNPRAARKAELLREVRQLQRQNDALQGY